MPQAVAPTISDRLLAAFRALVRAELPQLTFMGVYEYTVTGTDGSTVDCTPTDTTIPIPALSKVPTRTAVDGFTVTLPNSVVGLRCLVAFVNSDPARPMCIGMDPIPGSQPVARKGDTVTITNSQLTTAGAVAGGNPVTVTTSIQASITGGSSVLKAP